MLIFESEERLAEEVAKSISPGQTVRMGIDGKDGSGKTTLAQRIAKHIKGKVISLDDYLEKKKGGYVAHLRIEEIRAILSGETRSLIVEGVCLLDVAERIGIKIDMLIYIKRMNPCRHWLDEEECDPKKSADDLIRRLEQLPNIFKECGPEERMPLPELTKEIICYHAKYRPLSRADYVFHRIEAE